MTYKIDEVLTMLDQLLMKVDRLERVLIDGEKIASPSKPASSGKPRLEIVKPKPNNIVEFDPND